MTHKNEPQKVLVSFVDLFSNLTPASDANAMNASGLLKSGKMLRVMRSTRIFRVLRTLKWVGNLEQYITTIVRAFASLGPIFKLFFSLVLIFSLLGCSLFGRILPVST